MNLFLLIVVFYVFWEGFVFFILDKEVDILIDLGLKSLEL